MPNLVALITKFGIEILDHVPIRFYSLRLSWGTETFRDHQEMVWDDGILVQLRQT